MPDHVGIINASATAAYKAAQTGCEIDITIGSGRNEVKVHIVPGRADVQLAGAPPAAVEAQPPFDQEEPQTAPLKRVDEPRRVPKWDAPPTKD